MVIGTWQRRLKLLSKDVPAGQDLATSYASFAYCSRTAASMIASAVSPQLVRPHALQMFIEMVTRQNTWPLSVSCRKASCRSSPTILPRLQRGQISLALRLDISKNCGTGDGLRSMSKLTLGTVLTRFRAGCGRRLHHEIFHRAPHQAHRRQASRAWPAVLGSCRLREPAVRGANAQADFQVCKKVALSRHPNCCSIAGKSRVVSVTRERED